MSGTLTFERRKCLVLNKNWAPIETKSLRDALTTVFSCYKDGQPKASIIDPSTYETFTWEDWSKLRPAEGEDRIIGANCFLRVPEIIKLNRFEKMPRSTHSPHFSRRTLYKRDEMRCQYCGKRPGSEELTIDHIIPSSRGGGTTWENTVLACVECNSRKANRTPEEANMKLLKKPTKPKANLIRFDSYKPIKSWEQFLGAAYWSVTLSDE